MYQIVLFFHVLVAIALIVLVLVQRGKGASMGAAFGAGASQTVFGSQGSGSFLLKLTGVLGAIFFATTLGLGYIASQQQTQGINLPTSQIIPQVPLNDEQSATVGSGEQSTETTAAEQAPAEDNASSAQDSQGSQ